MPSTTVLVSTHLKLTREVTQKTVDIGSKIQCLQLYSKTDLKNYCFQRKLMIRIQKRKTKIRNRLNLVLSCINRKTLVLLILEVHLSQKQGNSLNKHK